MMHFTDDELNLICIYDTKSKSALIDDLQRALPYIEEGELKSITKSVLSKFRAMSNAEFSCMEFSPTIGGDEYE